MLSRASFMAALSWTTVPRQEWRLLEKWTLPNERSCLEVTGHTKMQQAWFQPSESL